MNQWVRCATLMGLLLPRIAFAQQEDHQDEVLELSAAPGSTIETIKGGTGAVLMKYLNVKNALVMDNGKVVQLKAVALVKALKAIRTQNLAPADQRVYHSLRRDLLYDAENMARLENLDRQRFYFSDLSKNMVILVRELRPLARIIYYNACPTRFDGMVAHWLSEYKPIDNPYFDQEMRRCGTIQETYLPGH